MKRSHRVYDAFKRAADVVVALLALVVLSPLLLVLAIAVRLSLGTPVLFRQQRPGRGGVPFTLYKFRTMRVADTDGSTDIEAVTTDTERLTGFGRFLRASSLDELPELWNVVRGDMSLIGPRPLLTEYLTRYNAEQARRHEVRPGLTGWAQVNGRNALDWQTRFALDVWYVDNRSLGLDLRILLKSVATVLLRRGVSAEGHATMEPFDPDRYPPARKEDS